MSNNWVEVRLQSIGGGAAIDQFDHQLKEAMKNCLDLNTDATAQRTVTLKVTIKPNQQRSEAIVEYQANSKLAADSAGAETVTFNQAGKAFVRDSVQLPLGLGETFDPETGEVTMIGDQK